MKTTRIIFRILTVIFLLPVLLGGALYWLNEKGYFNLDRIEVFIDGTELEPHYLKPQMEQVEKMIEANRGKSLWRIDLPELQKEIKRLGWVDNIVLVREWPTVLKAKIKPFDVKVLFLSKKGQLFPIVENGEMLSPLEMKNIPDATVLRGDNFQKDASLRKKAIQVLNEIPQDGTFSRSQISEVFYKEKEGFWVSLIRNGMEVRLGQEQVGIKSGRVSQVIEYLQQHQLEARVIDADLSQKVLVRLRKGP